MDELRNMQIPDEIRKCVAFAACERQSGKQIAGTVFFIGLEIAPDRFATYAVTARHVIEDIKTLAIDPKVMYLRVNLRTSGWISSK